MKKRHKQPEPQKPLTPHPPSQLAMDWSSTPQPTPPGEATNLPAGTPAPVVAKYSLREITERCLRSNGFPYIAVDEAKRLLFAGAHLRSFHFVVYRVKGPNWLVFAAWVRPENRIDLRNWEGIFGTGFIAVIVKQDSEGVLRWRTLDGEPLELLPKTGTSDR